MKFPKSMKDILFNLYPCHCPASSKTEAFSLRYYYSLYDAFILDLGLEMTFRISIASYTAGSQLTGETELVYQLLRR